MQLFRAPLYELSRAQIALSSRRTLFRGPTSNLPSCCFSASSTGPIRAVTPNIVEGEPFPHTTSFNCFKAARNGQHDSPPAGAGGLPNPSAISSDPASTHARSADRMPTIPRGQHTPECSSSRALTITSDGRGWRGCSSVRRAVRGRARRHKQTPLDAEDIYAAPILTARCTSELDALVSRPGRAGICGLQR